MTRIDQAIYVLLGLVIVMLTGMIIGSWRAVLYPFLIVIGITIFLGLIKDIEQTPKKIWIPISVSVIYLVLYIAHDVLTLDSSTGGSSFIFGLSPSMALYLVGIWPMAVFVCLLFTLTFSTKRKQQKEAHIEQRKINSGGSN